MPVPKVSFSAKHRKTVDALVRKVSKLFFCDRPIFTLELLKNEWMWRAQISCPNVGPMRWYRQFNGYSVYSPDHAIKCLASEIQKYIKRNSTITTEAVLNVKWDKKTRKLVEKGFQ